MGEQQQAQTEAFTSERLPGVKAAIVKQMLAASDEMNVEKSLKFCSDSVLYQFGNFPAVVGPQAIAESSANFLQNFKALKHNIKTMWEVGDNVIVEMKVTYTRHDDQVFTLPCCNIISMKGDVVQEMRIYMDISPVFA